mmetsp:Transcript_49693/g.82754  ORF Transcript_49693/g.82754 Transcript_49693/m.82754 type:complete len:209 (-) Transcript_49693:325-951(-)
MSPGVFNPSIAIRKAVLTLRDAPDAPPPVSFSRDVNKLSTSSINMIAAFLSDFLASFVAQSNSASTSLSEAPNFESSKSFALGAKNETPHCFATALAIRVLPVPGGPYSSTLHPSGADDPISSNTHSWNKSFTSCTPMMSSKVMSSICSGAVIQLLITSRYSFCSLCSAHRLWLFCVRSCCSRALLICLATTECTCVWSCSLKSLRTS